MELSGAQDRMRRARRHESAFGFEFPLVVGIRYPVDPDDRDEQQMLDACVTRGFAETRGPLHVGIVGVLEVTGRVDDGVNAVERRG